MLLLSTYRVSHKILAFAKVSNGYNWEGGVWKGLGVCTVGCSISFVFVNINKINKRYSRKTGKEIKKINFQKGKDNKKSWENIYPGPNR